MNCRIQYMNYISVFHNCIYPGIYGINVTYLDNNIRKGFSIRELLCNVLKHKEKKVNIHGGCSLIYHGIRSKFHSLFLEDLTNSLRKIKHGHTNRLDWTRTAEYIYNSWQSHDENGSNCNPKPDPDPISNLWYCCCTDWYQTWWYQLCFMVPNCGDVYLRKRQVGIHKRWPSTTRTEWSPLQEMENRKLYCEGMAN